MFSCVWLYFKKIFGKCFLMFGCILENTIENTFFTCCSHFLTFSQLPNKHIMSFIPKNSNKTQKDSIFSRRDRDRDRRDLDWRDRDRNLTDLDRYRNLADLDREIAIAISLISMIAINADRRDRDRRDRDQRDRDRDRRRSAQFRSRRDRDRGASVWVVPAQWRLHRAVIRVRACACESRACAWWELVRVSGNQLKRK